VLASTARAARRARSAVERRGRKGVRGEDGLRHRQEIGRRGVAWLLPRGRAQVGDGPAPLALLEGRPSSAEQRGNEGRGAAQRGSELHEGALRGPRPQEQIPDPGPRRRLLAGLRGQRDQLALGLVVGLPGDENLGELEPGLEPARERLLLPGAQDGGSVVADRRRHVARAALQAGELEVHRAAARLALVEAEQVGPRLGDAAVGEEGLGETEVRAPIVACVDECRAQGLEGLAGPARLESPLAPREPLAPEPPLGVEVVVDDGRGQREEGRPREAEAEEDEGVAGEQPLGPSPRHVRAPRHAVHCAATGADAPAATPADR
jgi:hypothetical protein